MKVKHRVRSRTNPGQGEPRGNMVVPAAGGHGASGPRVPNRVEVAA